MPNRRIAWQGQSGVKYTYFLFEFGSLFDQIPGNFIFAQENMPHKFIPLYIGQTPDLRKCYESHDQMPCIRQHGATHICVHARLQGEKFRNAEMIDLINAYRPACNI